MKCLLCACFLMLCLPAATRAETPGTLSTRYIAIAIQGDLRPAYRLLEEQSAHVSPADLDLASRFRQRFVDHSESPEPSSGNVLVDQVVSAYQDYWRAALIQGVAQERAEARLVSALNGTTQQHRPVAARLAGTDVYAALGPLLEAQGFHAVVSHAAPLQDLFVWRRQDIDNFEVELTDQVREVRVAFLSDFASLGWKYYASLGLASTTGWVEGDTLYCVEWAYAPDTENFEVSYLKHEAQHLADFERFPGLPSAELEYRAKLTELAFASTTLRRLLDDFSAKSAPNPDSPHAEANWRVVRDVYAALYGEEPAGDVHWAGVDLGHVNRTARQLLAEDTARLENRL